MKRILILATDIIIIFGSIILSYMLLKGQISTLYTDHLRAISFIAPLIAILYIILSYIFGLYNSLRQRLSEVIYTVFLITITFTIGTMAACYFVKGGSLAFPRSIILTSAFIYGLFLVCWHILEWRMTKKIHGVKDILIIGKSAGTLAQHIENTHKDIYNIKYICDENDPELWNKIDRVKEIFITSNVAESKRDNIFHYAVEKNTAVFFIPKYSDIGIINATLYKTDDIPTYRISRMELTVEELFVKRALDIFLSGIAMIVVLPIFLLILFFIRLDGGPAFYTQERLTLGGRKFRVLKFRSMVPNAEQLSGPTLADEDDPRITRLGKLLRSTRMDELPQLINILKGDMSIVGPRPERPFFADQFTQEMPEYHHRLKVKAGLTGLAQIMGKYNTHVSQKLRYDLIYINNYSILKDFIIMLQTIKILFMKSSTEGITSLQKAKQEQTIPQEGFELNQN